MYVYINNNNILPDSQCGFRKGLSTSIALTNVVDDIIHARDIGKSCALILLDFSKAFDTINHELLCSKLKYYRFDVASCNLIRSYLFQRSLIINSLNKFSTEIVISSGVPQGSVLGPLLFLIYTSDILKSLKNCKVQAFADDTQIYYDFNHPDYIQASQLINDDLLLLNELASDHNLQLNPSKSFVMLFSCRNTINFLKDNFNLHLNDVRLPFVYSTKNLGIILDSDFRFRDYIRKVLQKTFFNLKLLYSNRHILNFSLKKNLCESLVLSHFNYCDFLYGFCLDNFTVSRIQKVQNCCLRLIFNLRKYDHVSHTLNRLKWLNMKNRRTLHFGVFIFKIINSLHPPLSLKNKLVPRSRIHSRNIRYTNKFTLPKHRTALFRRSFTYNAVKLFNSFNNEFMNLSITNFKKKFKKYLFGKQ